MKIKSDSKLENCLHKFYYSNISHYNSSITEHSPIYNLKQQIDLSKKNDLSPNWITGFSDAVRRPVVSVLL